MAIDGYIRTYNLRVDPDGKHSQKLKDDDAYFEFDYQKTFRAHKQNSTQFKIMPPKETKVVSGPLTNDGKDTASFGIGIEYPVTFANKDVFG
jgi:hypothetical protein